MEGSMKKHLLCAVLTICILLPGLSCDTREKIGILYIDVGSPEHHDLDWYVDFFQGISDIFYPGWFAGGPIDGGTCYTLIHYASEAEAEICDVEEGTPIDAFCNEYTGDYPVESLVDFGPDGDNSFADDCYSPGFPFPLIILQGHSTIDPETGEEIIAPVIKDPEGTGIGIADFLEMSALARLDWLHRLPNHTDPQRELTLKMLYGNDASGYTQESPELSNIKDRLAELLPEYDLVFRHGWEGYMENRDAYGNPETMSDSTQTAIEELINEEKVDRIVVFHPTRWFSNSIHYGHEWYDVNGQGVSSLPGKTFKECIEDASDNVGPATQEDINTYLAEKPLDTHWKHLYPLIESLAKEVDPAVPLSFAPPSAHFEQYDYAGLEMLEYTIEKYRIPRDASLMVLLIHHGFYGGYMNAQDCDCYFTLNKDNLERFISRIKTDLDWSGKLDVVSAGVEFAEAHYDFPSSEKPFGEVMSAGEIIDMSINGAYVNTMGQVVDNGIENFDYIIVDPYSRTESQDSVYGLRSETLGNNIYTGMSFYQRDERDGDGTEFDAGDIDDEYFTVKVLDATGWPSYTGCLESPETCEGTGPAYKGSAQSPTTLIYCGAITANSAGAGRDKLIEAAVKSITYAIDNPETRGVLIQ